MTAPFSSISCGRSVWTVQHMGHLFIRSVAEGTPGVCLILSVKQLIAYSNTPRKKFPAPALEPRRKLVDGFGTRSPVYC